MSQKSQRLINPAEMNRNQSKEKSTHRFARAYYGVFSLSEKNDVETHDPRLAYRSSVLDWFFLGFLIWFISII